jgi:hypothetical protein
MPDVLGPTRRIGMRLLQEGGMGVAGWAKTHDPCRQGIPMPDVLGPTRRIGMRGIRMP